MHRHVYRQTFRCVDRRLGFRAFATVKHVPGTPSSKSSSSSKASSRRWSFGATLSVLLFGAGSTSLLDSSGNAAHAEVAKPPPILEENKLIEGPLCNSVSVYAVRGQRPAMEDEYFVSEDQSFFGVYDGHGGDKVSKATRKFLFQFFDKWFFSEPVSALPHAERVEASFMKAFNQLSDLVLGNWKLAYEGSTAVAVLLQEGEIWSANVGDSRAILCRNNVALDLTVDHKPNSESELARIEALGGRVRWHGYVGPDKQPVPGMGAYRINGNLAVSRALGDSGDRPFVSSVPEVKQFERDEENDQFIVLASDGLWDVMSSQDVVDFVIQILAGSVGALRDGSEESDGGGMASTSSPAGVRPATKRLSQWMKRYSGDRGMLRAVIETRRAKMSQYLVEESIRRGTSDNVTVIVVWLR